MRQNDLQVEYAEKAHGKQQRQHGRNAFAGAAHRSGQRVHHGGQPVERAEYAQRLHAVVDHGLVAAEKPQQRVGKCDQQHGHHSGVHNAHGNGDPHSLFHALQLACAVVLAHKSGDGHAKA